MGRSVSLMPVPFNVCVRARNREEAELRSTLSTSSRSPPHFPFEQLGLTNWVSD